MLVVPSVHALLHVLVKTVLVSPTQQKHYLKIIKFTETKLIYETGETPCIKTEQLEN